MYTFSHPLINIDTCVCWSDWEIDVWEIKSMQPRLRIRIESEIDGPDPACVC